MRKGKFASMVQRATDLKWSPATIKSGWKRVGLIPFNPDEVDKKWLVKKKESKYETEVITCIPKDKIH